MLASASALGGVNAQRRQILGAGLAAALTGAGCGQQGQSQQAQQQTQQQTQRPGPNSAEPPEASTAAGYRMVGDFEPTRAIWLGYDHGHTGLTVALAKALLPHVRLRVLVSEPDHLDAARTLLRSQGLDTSQVQFDLDRQAVFFVRDAAVFSRGTVGPVGRLGLVDFRWSQYGLRAWCDKRHANNRAAADQCASPLQDNERDGLDRNMARLAGAAASFSTPLALEGGGIECNGAGVVLVSQALAEQRNPGVPVAQLKAQFEQLPGVKKLVWLGEGLASDPHMRGTITGNYVAWGTGGHTDEFVRFADERTVLLSWPDDAEVAKHPVARFNRVRMQRNFELLAAATDADGRPFRIIKLPVPRSVERRVFLSAAADERLSAEWTANFFPDSERRYAGQGVIQVASCSYLNFVVANGVVVVPSYAAHGTPSAVEQRLKGLMQQAFPGRAIVFVDAMGANWVGGGPHCATLNEPVV